VLAATLTANAQTVAGPITNPANGHRYYVIRIANWADYAAAAANLGGYQVVINDGAENEWIRTSVRNLNVPAGFVAYIGLTDTLQEGDWRWTDVVDGYRNWAPGEPNNFNANQDYAIQLSSGQWDDYIAPPPDSGNGLQYAIVEAEPAGPASLPKGIIVGPVTNRASNTDYYLIARSQFAAARTFAQSLGGELAKVTDAAENDFIVRSLLDYPGISTVARIGLTDVDAEGQWKWSGSNTASTYFRWDIGEPTNSGGNEDYVGIYTAFPIAPARTGFWNDLPDNSFVSVVEVVRCPADFNNSGQASVQDIFDFLAAYFTGCP
jgi:hypothetical protein